MTRLGGIELVSYVEFVGAVALLVTTSITYLINGKPKLREGGIHYHSLSTYEDRSEENGRNGPYQLRYRVLLWYRQIAFFLLLGASIYDFATRHLTDGVTSYLAHILYILAIFLIILADDVRNLGQMTTLKQWLTVYAIILVHRLLVFACLQTWFTALEVAIAASGFIFATLCAYLDLYRLQVNLPTEEYTCGLLSSWTFSYLNRILIQPGVKKESLEFEDVPTLVDDDSAHHVWEKFRLILQRSKKVNLWWSLYELVKWEWYVQGFFQFVASTANYISPLALERILLHISHDGNDDDDVYTLIPIDVKLAVFLLVLGPLIMSVADGQNFVRGRHIGIRVKGALIAALYNKALTVDMSASKESVGKLNNLISVDVSDIQAFCCYTHLMWGTLLEIAISSFLLFVVLGRAAFAGMTVLGVSLVLGISVSKIVEYYQAELLKTKDVRIGIVNEVLNSVRVIKYYAWEHKFARKIDESRKAELRNLRKYCITDAALFIIWEVVPALVGATAFVVHTYYLGQPLTPATGFTALTLFNLLRFPLDCFPDMINYYVRTKVSLRRIEGFLRTVDVRGLTDLTDFRSEDELNEYADFPTAASSSLSARQSIYSPSSKVLEGRSTGVPEYAPKAFQTSSEASRFDTSRHPLRGEVCLRNFSMAWAPTRRAEDADDETADADAGRKRKRQCCSVTRRKGNDADDDDDEDDDDGVGDGTGEEEGGGAGYAGSFPCLSYCCGCRRSTHMEVLNDSDQLGTQRLSVTSPQKTGGGSLYARVGGKNSSLKYQLLSSREEEEEEGEVEDEARRAADVENGELIFSLADLTFSASNAKKKAKASMHKLSTSFFFAGKRRQQQRDTEAYVSSSHGSREDSGSANQGHVQESQISMLSVDKWTSHSSDAPISNLTNKRRRNSDHRIASGESTGVVPINNTTIFRDANLRIPQGSLAVVVGVTGAGKSSLLHGALLGEALHLAGVAGVGGRISYASQSPWIQNATLRDNILFGHAFDASRYEQVLHCCALLSDLQLLPAGDMTEIGEKGVNLSGGQQQRVNLARAAYAYSDVVLLDDPLSAVDTLVGEHIFNHLVVGFLKDRTRILVTHNVALAVAAADLVICIDGAAAAAAAVAGAISSSTTATPTTGTAAGFNVAVPSTPGPLPHSPGTLWQSSLSPPISSSAAAPSPFTSSSVGRGEGQGRRYGEEESPPRSRIVACCAPGELAAVILPILAERRSASNSSSSSNEINSFLETLMSISTSNSSFSPTENTSTPSTRALPNNSPLLPNALAPAGSIDSPDAAQCGGQNESMGIIDSLSPVPPTPSSSSSSSSSSPPRGLLENHSYESLRYSALISADTSGKDNHRSAAMNNTIRHVPDTSRLSGESLNAGNNNAPGGETLGKIQDGKIVEKETKSAGEVGWGVYWFYLKACGGILAVVSLLGGSLATSGAWLFTNVSLGRWMDAMEEGGSTSTNVTAIASNASYTTSSAATGGMEIEGALAAQQQGSIHAFHIYAVSILIILTTTFMRTVGEVMSNLTSSKRLHSGLVKSVMAAPCGWFDATPVGRIVNRFSQDISTVDSNIITHLYGFVNCLLSSIQIFGVVSFMLPILFIPFIPIMSFTWWVSRQYLHISRELKRLESVKKSPVFVLFSETLQGLPVVRSFREEHRFFRTCCDRIDEMNRCHLYLWICNRWLNFRMQTLGACVAGVVGLAVVMQRETIGSTAAGLALIYSLNFCDTLTWLTRAHANVQMDLNSVERIQEYSDLPMEKYKTHTEATVAAGGAVTSSNDSSSSGGGGSPHVEWNKDKEREFLLQDEEEAVHSNEGEEQLQLQKDLECGALYQPPSTSTATTVAADVGKSGTPPLQQQQQQQQQQQRWPSQGRVEFRRITLKYNSNSKAVLRDVSFTIPGKTKVGVVGRTGAGKSSLIAALFRIVEPCGGELLIDNENILAMPLHTVRNNIAIVPQEPTLFRGSVRFNLDPFNQHTEDELWAALTSAHLADFVTSMESDTSSSSPTSSSTIDVGAIQGNRSNSDDYPIHTPNSVSSKQQQQQQAGGTPRVGRYRGALEEKQVAEKGANFSVGQRQLLCMARAILRKASVLVLDECTASVDHETDALIQETVRRELVDCTIICIAHRLHTIAYYDSVLVMDAGRVVEFGDPYELMMGPSRYPAANKINQLLPVGNVDTTATAATTTSTTGISKISAATKIATALGKPPLSPKAPPPTLLSLATAASSAATPSPTTTTTIAGEVAGQSLFRQMCLTSGAFDELQKIAKQAYDAKHTEVGIL